MLTIREHFGKLKGLKLVYFGDARYNIGNSLCIVCSKLGLNLTLCAPKKYFPNEALVAECSKWCKESGGTITLEEDVAKAATDADIIYTDVWVSMGEPDEVWAERIADLKAYQVNSLHRHMDEAQVRWGTEEDLPSNGTACAQARKARSLHVQVFHRQQAAV